MSRSVFLGAATDSPWSDEDRAWATALLAYEKALCSCGQPVAESFAPENEFEYTATLMRCHACAQADRATEALPESADRAGLRVQVTRKGGVNVHSHSLR